MKKFVSASAIFALLASLTLAGAVFAGSGVPAGVTVSFTPVTATTGTLTVSGNYTCNDVANQGLAVFKYPDGPSSTGTAPLYKSLQNSGTITTPPGVQRASPRNNNTFDLTDNCNAKGVRPFTLTYDGVANPGVPARFCLAVYHRKSINGSNPNITADGPLRNTDNSFENQGNVYKAADCGFIPKLITQVVPATSVVIGNPISDTATLSGMGVGNATDTIQFKAYAPSNPTTNPCGTAEFTSAFINVTGNGTYSSGSFVPAEVGDYHWRAFYSGGGDTGATSTPCLDNNETSPVGKGSPTISTTATTQASLASGPVNINDVAHVLQPPNTINTHGAITFDVYGPGDTTCATSLATLNAITTPTNGTGDYTSANYLATTAGTYRWIAHLAQDTNNNAANGTCTSANEQTLVINPSIRVTKDPRNQSFASGGTATWTIVVTNNGDSALSNVSTTDAQAADCARSNLGSLAIGASTSYTCTKSNVTAAFDNVVVACGTPPVGANVCDDSNTTLTVRTGHVGLEALSTTQVITPNDAGTVTVTNASAPNGLLTFKLYRNDTGAPATCDAAHLVKDYGAFPVDANGTAQTNNTTFTVSTNGTYNWLVSYAGDTNNNAAFSGTCGTENFTITNGH